MDFEQQDENVSIVAMANTTLPATSTPALAAIARSEVECQLDAAHKYPRKISLFLDEARTMIAISPDVAAMCFYTLPRKDKNGRTQSIMGPSVRLAEIAASAYGNLHVGARPLDVAPTDTDCVSQGVAWDLQKNVRYSVEQRRRITTKNGHRFSDDMVIVTQNAASSIALRNAILRVIPRAYINELYEHARRVAVGDVRAIGEKRKKVVERLIQMGVCRERILAKIGRADVEDITADDLAVLIGYGTAIHDGQTTIEEVFAEEIAAPKPTLKDLAAENRKLMSDMINPKPSKIKAKKSTPTEADEERAAIQDES